MTNKTLYIFGIFLIAGFAILSIFEMQELKTPYITTKAELLKNDNRRIQFLGTIQEDEYKYDEKLDTLLFSIVGDDKQKLKVSYKGIMPANFDTAEKAVVIGKYNGEEIIAEKILLKCPSKYEGKSN